MGFAAASIDVLEFKIVVIPALAIDIVYCSIASWMAILSSAFILSNSSMHTTPPSARTIAPPSKWNCPDDLLFIIEAVRPAADDPLPLV